MSWRPILGFEGIYDISDQGQVRRLTSGRGHCRAGRLLKPRPNRKGYLRVALHHHRRADRTLHQLVAETFIGPRPSAKAQVNHKDGNKANNAVSNLEWVTPLENARHAQACGLVPPLRGEANGRAKLTREQVLQIREDPRVARVVAAEYSVSISLIGAIRRREIWTEVA